MHLLLPYIGNVNLILLRDEYLLVIRKVACGHDMMWFCQFIAISDFLSIPFEQQTDFGLSERCGNESVFQLFAN